MFCPKFWYFSSLPLVLRSFPLIFAVNYTKICRILEFFAWVLSFLSLSFLARSKKACLNMPLLSNIFKGRFWKWFWFFFSKIKKKTFLKVKIQALLSESLQQLNSFISVWILSCLFQALLSENFFSHFEQLNGFSSVWILSCCLQMLWLAELLFTI